MRVHCTGGCVCVCVCVEYRWVPELWHSAGTRFRFDLFLQKIFGENMVFCSRATLPHVIIRRDSTRVKLCWKYFTIESNGGYVG